jgi:spore germination protein YaaH
MINAKNALLLLFHISITISSVALPETWAYLMKGEEKYFPAASSITDVACFSASINEDGHLAGGHQEPPVLSGATPGVRYHLVVTMPWNTTLAHIFLNPELPFRDRIISGIVERSAPFQGIQIDFESISPKDGTAYLNFLAELKKALPEDKLFSVAVLARWASHKKGNPDDAFDYSFIGLIADRVVVMAYDEHYGGGKPGPIASLPWCEKIFRYALETIPPDKLVMGIPLYGRSWQDSSWSKTYKNRDVVGQLMKRGIKSTWHPENGGSFDFTETIRIHVYYETTQSLREKIKLYKQEPIRGVAFWRIGQEPSGFLDEL